MRWPRRICQRPAAEALVRVQRQLAGQGCGLLIFDAYRPWFVTKVFWEATPPEQRGFVADPARGSTHNRGGAVDLTLCEHRGGTALDMGSDFDDFSERARPDFAGCTPAQGRHRRLLRDTMTEQGFRVNPLEWWHFDHEDGPSYPLLNIPLEAVQSSAPPC